MSKVALISDIHLGIRNDSVDFLHNHEKFFNEVFFPECKKRNIHIAIHCGDLTDRRKHINFHTINKSKKFFFEKVKQNFTKFYSIVGNHDSYYRNTIKINSHRELDVSQYNIITIDKPLEVEIYDQKLCFIPWICPDNEKEAFSLISSTNAQFCFGHFAIENFEMQKGRICENGLNPEMFEKFTQVFSGHFHKSTAKDNILYLGSPTQFTWNDYGDERGFYIFDLVRHELEFIPNPFSMFTKIEYDENKSLDENLGFHMNSIENTFCKVIIKSPQTDKNKFKKFLENIKTDKLLDLKVIDSSSTIEEDRTINDEDLQDTKTILMNYSKDDKKLQNLLLDLYSEALLLE